jgi:hypothetical protein
MAGGISRNQNIVNLDSPIYLMPFFYIILYNSANSINNLELRVRARAFASIRNLAISLLRLHGFKNIVSVLC